MSAAPIRGAEKPRLIHVTDPAEIAAVRRNDLFDPIGTVLPDGTCWAYAWSIERWRERAANYGDVAP